MEPQRREQDLSTERSTSWFNASFFPESSYHNVSLDDLLGASYEANSNPFDKASFVPPKSYDNLRKETKDRKNASTSSRGLILGNAQYQTYYPTNEEVPLLLVSVRTWSTGSD